MRQDSAFGMEFNIKFLTSILLLQCFSPASILVQSITFEIVKLQALAKPDEIGLLDHIGFRFSPTDEGWISDSYGPDTSSEVISSKARIVSLFKDFSCNHFVFVPFRSYR